MSSNASIILFGTSLFRLSQGCALRLFPPISNTRLLCVGTRGLSQLSSHRHGTGIHHHPINALFPSLSSSRRALSKVFCQSAAAKAEPRLNIAGVSWHSSSKKDTGTEHLERLLLRDGESKGEALTARKKLGSNVLMWGRRRKRTLQRCVKVHGRHLWQALRGRTVMKRDNASKQSGADE